MGALFSSLFSSWFGSQDVRILILGLDGAGKTTILYRLQCGEVIRTAPTIGFNIESIVYKNVNLRVWDLGGQTSLRPHWRLYFNNTQAVIYVVDSADRERMELTKRELHALLEEEELQDASLLVLANKQDLPDALSEADVSECLALHELTTREWAIFKSTAIKGEGLFEGLDWLCSTIANK